MKAGERNRLLLPREQPWDDDNQGPAANRLPLIRATVHFDWSELWEKVQSWLPWSGR